MNTLYDISIILITYYPKKEELIRTLNSLVFQQNCSFEIVVADDGSAEDPSALIRKYFEIRNFPHYRIVRNEQNQGTVKNFISGIEQCSGRYVKAISPGDYLYSADVLEKWLHHMKSSDKPVSFGDVVSYRLEQGEIIPFSSYARPQSVHLYQKDKVRAAKKNYLLFGDAIHGTAVLLERDFYLRYLKCLEGKVIYCEDMAMDLIVLENTIPSYFPKSVVLYEVGTGISTQKDSGWNSRMAKDRRAMTEIILEHCKDEDFQKKYKAAVGAKWSTSNKKRIKKYLYNPEIVWKRLKLLFRTRKTSETIDQEFTEKIREIPDAMLAEGDIV